MKTSYPEETAMNDPEYNELLRRALEPFRPTCTMDDVLKREAEIREASIDYLKEECKRTRKCKKDTEIRKASNMPHLDYDVKIDF